MKALTTLFVIGMFATAVAIADDVDDVIAAVRKYTTALNTEDANALMQLHAVESTSFDPRGGLLETFDSLEQAVLNNDTGLKYNLQARDIGVRVYGNLTAVATSYAVGTITRLHNLHETKCFQNATNKFPNSVYHYLVIL